jgi:hypothetical protein
VTSVLGESRIGTSNVSSSPAPSLPGISDLLKTLNTRPFSLGNFLHAETLKMENFGTSITTDHVSILLADFAKLFVFGGVLA